MKGGVCHDDRRADDLVPRIEVESVSLCCNFTALEDTSEAFGQEPSFGLRNADRMN